MSIFTRCSDIIRSNINALLDKAEDPAKMVDQLLLDSRRDLAEVKKETASVMAEEKAAKRALDEAESMVARYEAAATKAVTSGNDDDARDLLSRQQQTESTLPALRERYAAAQQNAKLMRDATKKLQDDITALEARKEGVKAKVATAKAQERMNKIQSGTKNRADVSSAFSRLEDAANRRLDAATAESELHGEMAAADTLEKYETGTGSVEDKLAALKEKLGKS